MALFIESFLAVSNVQNFLCICAQLFFYILLLSLYLLHVSQVGRDKIILAPERIQLPCRLRHLFQACLHIMFALFFVMHVNIVAF